MRRVASARVRARQAAAQRYRGNPPQPLPPLLRVQAAGRVDRVQGARVQVHVPLLREGDAVPVGQVPLQAALPRARRRQVVGGEALPQGSLQGHRCHSPSRRGRPVSPPRPRQEQGQQAKASSIHSSSSGGPLAGGGERGGRGASAGAAEGEAASEAAVRVGGGGLRAHGAGGARGRGRDSAEDTGAGRRGERARPCCADREGEEAAARRRAVAGEESRTPYRAGLWMLCWA